MSDVRTKANNLNTGHPIAGVNNSSQGFRDNTAATQAALFQASDEIAKLQTTKFNFSGDASGGTDRLESAALLGGDPTLNVVFTLATIGAAADLNTALTDIALSVDAKGRVTATSKPGRTLNFAPGHAVNTAIGPQNAKGLISFPTFTFDNLGRLTATGKQEIDFTIGLLGQDFRAGGILVGNSNGKSIAFDSPAQPGAYMLTSSGTNLSWQPVNAGVVTGVTGSNGVKVSGDTSPVVEIDLATFPIGPGLRTNAAKIELDINNFPLGPGLHLSDSKVELDVNNFPVGPGLRINGTKIELDTVTFPVGLGLRVNNIGLPTIELDLNSLPVSNDFGDEDFIPWFDVSTSEQKKLTGRQLINKFRVSDDTAPQLGGVLDLNGYQLVNRRSEIPESSIELSESELALRVTEGNALTLNGVRWPTTGATLGKQLAMGTGNQLIWVDSAVQVPIRLSNTLFVSPDGNDTVGDGSIDNAFYTINKALQNVPTRSDSNWTIMLLGETYSENININNYYNLSIEGFYISRRTQLIGSIVIGSGVQKYTMSNLLLDYSNEPENNTTPVFQVTSGLESMNIQNCEFLRGSGSRSDLDAITLAGDITGDLLFNNCTIQGKVRNTTTSYNDAKVVFQNIDVPNESSMGLVVDGETNMVVDSVLVLKGIRHDRGNLTIANVQSVQPSQYSVVVENPRLPLWVNGEPVYKNDLNGNPLRYLDSDGEPAETLLLDEYGEPMLVPNSDHQEYQVTEYLQDYQAVTTTTTNYSVGLFSLAEAQSGQFTNQLNLQDVNFIANGQYSKIYKSGQSQWSFSDVKRRADQDYVAGPRTAYDIMPDIGQVLANYTASGQNLRFADTNASVPGAVVDLNAGNTFQITLTGPSTIKLLTPETTTAQAASFFAEITIGIKQDGSGNRTVNFVESSGQGITWLGSSGTNLSPNSLTFYSFRYFAESRRWVATRQTDSLKVSNIDQLNYVLTLTDAGNYVRRNHSQANEVIVPTASTAQFVVGAQIQVVQVGTGRTSIRPAGGVVINTPDGFTLRKRYSKVTLTKVANNIWDLEGDLDETIQAEPTLTIDRTDITSDNGEVTADNG